MPFIAGSVRMLTDDDVRSVLRIPEAASDKRSRGVVGLRTGSEAFPGAAVLGVEGAWRAGAGYVCYVGGRRAADLVLARRPETVAVAPGERAPRIDAWVIGSGVSAQTRSAAETAALRPLLAGAAPVVVDAGALDLLPGAAAPVVATPHEREFERLRAEVELPPLPALARGDVATRAAAVQETASALGGTVLLKGAVTLVADPDAEKVYAVDAGTPWLATAGTGDVLAGVIGALVAADRAAGGTAGLGLLAAVGAWLHGTAGRIAADALVDLPGRPVVALDVAEALPAAFAFAVHGHADRDPAPAGSRDAEDRA